MEFKRIEKTIEGYYTKKYNPDLNSLLDTIFLYPYDDLTYDLFYIVTWVTDTKIYYRKLHKQKYNPSWESKQLSSKFIYFSCPEISVTKYVFKYNKTLMDEYAKESLTIDEFNNMCTCIQDSEVYQTLSNNNN
jgi:hypothetical protein